MILLGLQVVNQLCETPPFFVPKNLSCIILELYHVLYRFTHNANTMKSICCSCKINVNSLTNKASLH